MTQTPARWRRRKSARPGEIVEAALAVFAESGFAAAKLDEIASRAGVAKGSIYLYFETKEDLFRAVVSEVSSSKVDAIRAAIAGFDGSFADVGPYLVHTAGTFLSSSDVAAMVRMVVGEARSFPDIAKIWHDSVVFPIIEMLAGLVARAQVRGEVAPGDPRLHAMSLMGPLVMGMLFREVFVGAAAELPNLESLAKQHARTALHGLLTRAVQTDADAKVAR